MDAEQKWFEMKVRRSPYRVQVRHIGEYDMASGGTLTNKDGSYSRLFLLVKSAS